MTSPTPDPSPDTDPPDGADPPSAPRPKRPGVGRIVAVVLLVLAVPLAAEGVLRAAPALPAPLIWHDQEVQSKAEVVRSLADDEPPVEIVIAGSSIADSGLDPAVMAAAEPSLPRIYNVAIAGSSMVPTDRWLRAVVLPELAPATLILGLTPNELNDNGQRQNAFADAMVGSRGYRDATGEATVEDQILTRAESASAIVRSRARLQDPYNALRYLTAGRTEAWSVDNDLTTGWSTTHENRTFTPPTEASREIARHEVFGDFALGGSQTEALLRTIDAAQAQGTRVILVEMPTLADELAQVLPGGADDLRRTHEHISSIAAARCVEVVDARDLLDDEASFSDAQHLNGSGTIALSEHLAALLADDGRSIPPPPC